MNIDGISEQILTRLFKENMVYDYSDLYHLDKYKEDIINFDGFGQKSYDNMISSIEKSRRVKLANFIYALGINEIGLSRAKLICKYCDNDIDKVRNITFEELSAIDGVGEVIAKTWIDTFNNPDFNSSLDKLLQEVEFIDVKNDKGLLKDQVFVITGSLEHFNNRDELINTIEEQGGKVISAVSAKVNYLINNDVNSSSTKNKKAHELGVKIISENDLLDMIKDS
jgi:DNA ligase (NAD+)